MSRTSVGRVWRAFGLKPRLAEKFKPSAVWLPVEKVRGVVGHYLSLTPPTGQLWYRGVQVRRRGKP